MTQCCFRSTNFPRYSVVSRQIETRTLQMYLARLLPFLLVNPYVYTISRAVGSRLSSVCTVKTIIVTPNETFFASDVNQTNPKLSFWPVIKASFDIRIFLVTTYAYQIFASGKGAVPASFIPRHPTRRCCGCRMVG